MITVKSNFSKITLDIQGKCNKLKDMKPVLNIIAQDMTKEAQLNFRNSQSPEGEKWQPLNTLTISMRRKGSSQPLVDTGILRRSIRGSANGTQAIAGTNIKYAAIHQFGGTIKPKNGKALSFGKHRVTKVVIPARPYLGINNKMNTRYKNLILDFIK